MECVGAAFTVAHVWLKHEMVYDCFVIGFSNRLHPAGDIHSNTHSNEHTRAAHPHAEIQCSSGGKNRRNGNQAHGHA